MSHSHGGRQCTGNHGPPAPPKGLTVEQLNDLFDDDPSPRDLIDPTVGPEPTTMTEACERGRLGTAVIFIARGVDPKVCDGPFGATPLHWAAYKGHMPVVKLLVDRGVNINACDVRGQTPIMWAINNLCFDVVLFLLQQGADPYLRDQRGCDSYSIASQSGSLAMLHLLHIHKPLPIDTKDNDGHNLLVWACYKGYLGLAEYLHEVHHVSLVAVDNQKRTALHWAAREGWIDVCMWLIQRGLNPSVPDADDVTALGWAAANRHFALGRLLKAGCKEPIKRVFGTAHGLWSNPIFLGHFVLGAVYIVVMYAVVTRWVPPALCCSLLGCYMLKNTGLLAILGTPIRNSKAQPTVMEIPRYPVETLRGTEILNYREPSITSMLLALLAVQYYALSSNTMEIHPLYYGLLLASGMLATLVKARCFADIVPRGTAAEDPVLRAVERKELADCPWRRIYNSDLHIRLPLRAFHSKELNEALYEYDGWSLLLDAPISRSTRRFFVGFLAALTLTHGYVFFQSFAMFWSRFCLPANEFSLLQFLWDMTISALPCKAPDDGSWFSYILPGAVNRDGFWLLIVTGGMMLILARELYSELYTASMGVTTLEAIHGTMPSTEGGLTPIVRNGHSLFANGSRLRTLAAFFAGTAGIQWRSAQAIPPAPGGMKK